MVAEKLLWCLFACIYGNYSECIPNNRNSEEIAKKNKNIELAC